MKIPSNDQLTRIGEVDTVVDEQKTDLPPGEEGGSDGAFSQSNKS